MPLEVIYVVRHGFRPSWNVDHVTGVYTLHIRSPTGLPTDPALTSHGVEQAHELAEHLLSLDPPIDQVYSSPYYRCLQTISPFVSRRNSGQNKVLASDPRSRLSIRVESGLSEWYGQAHFEHPTSAPWNELNALFADLDADYVSSPAPPRRGESISQLYERVASCIETIIAQCDREGKKSVLISTHAAPVVALGRVLTAKVPDDETLEDFKAFTCGLSKYRRQGIGHDGHLALGFRGASRSKFETPSQRSSFALSSHWTCEENSDCSFLSGGEERGWRFAGDESFVEVSQESLLPSTPGSHSNPTVKQGGDGPSGASSSKL